MNDDLGIEGLADDDVKFAGSRFAEVRDAIFANPYHPVWDGVTPFERFPVNFFTVMRGFLSLGKPWVLLAAARRTLASKADLRWGADGKGFRRLVHANAICMTGMWEISEETPYSGYFAKGSRGLTIARYSTCCTETRRGNTRSLSMVGRIYPTTDPEHAERLPTANFITQQDIGGDYSKTINEALLRNAPNTTVFRRGLGFPTLMATGAALNRAETQPTIRQVYQIAELGLTAGQPTRSPEFMQFAVVPEQPVIPGDVLDFRDEIMAQIYDRNDPQPKRTLTFHIQTSDEGTTRGNPLRERRDIRNWRTIGTVTFNAAVVSYNGDHVIHFNHPSWRNDRNDPATAHKIK
ncbi:MAG TPA: hypothetical protein VGQ46_07525 [Thermoanaerobaculia bacterium]|nr:hypothetical protein [Thermoanaerobaculia bacterium]